MWYKKHHKAASAAYHGPIEALPQPQAMIEDFLPLNRRKYKKPVLNATTEEPKTGASVQITDPDPSTQYPPTPQTQQDTEPNQDVMDHNDYSPYSTTTEPFEWNTLWQEVKGTLLWLIILTNVSIISYYQGKKQGSVNKTRRNIRTPPSFKLHSMPRTNLRRYADDDNFQNVSLHPCEHYKSVASLPLPLPPATTPTTRI